MFYLFLVHRTWPEVAPICSTSSSRRYVYAIYSFCLLTTITGPLHAHLCPHTPMPAVWLPPLCGMFLFSFCLLTIITSVPQAHLSHIHHAAQRSARPHALAQCGLALFRYFFSFFPSTSYSYMTPATLAHTCNHMLGRMNTRHDHPYTPTWHGSRLYVSFGLFFVV